MVAENGIVHLWNLPEDRICIKLPNDFQKRMIRKALNITRGRYNLSKQLDVNPATLYDFEKCRFRSTSLSFIKKLSCFLESNGFNEFSLQNIETNLEFIKTKWVGKGIFNPVFPIKFNCEEGAEVISGILFDGGLTKNYYPFYTNNEEFLIERMIKNIKKLVGNIEYYKRKYENTFEIAFHQTFGFILNYGLGFPPGKKVFTNPAIPKFIFNSSVSVQKAFLKHAFDDEASVNMGRPDGGSKAIQLEQYYSKNKTPIRLIQLKKLIERFDIKVSGPYGPTVCYKNKSGYFSYGWMIQITNKSNIEKFFKIIQFSLPRKQIALEKLLNTYKLPLKRSISHFDKGFELIK